MDEVYPQKVMVESHTGSLVDLQSPSTFSYWKTNFKTDVCSGSGHPTEAMPWIRETELANSIDDLKTSLELSQM